MLTEKEIAVVEGLGALWNQMQEVIGEGPAKAQDQAEAAFHIHGLQRMVLGNSAAREYPERFRLLGKVL